MGRKQWHGKTKMESSFPFVICEEIGLIFYLMNGLPRDMRTRPIIFSDIF